MPKQSRKYVGMQRLCGVGRAGFELLLARIRFGSLQFDSLKNPMILADTKRQPVAVDRIIERVRYFVPRVARRMPFRADCLIQALAAQRWLGRQGIGSALRIGARVTDRAGFEAHAWLDAGATVVTGWDIEGFEEFVAFPAPRDVEKQAPRLADP